MDIRSIYYLSIRWLSVAMSTECLNRTSDVIETPRVNVDVLKQRLLEQQKKDKVKKTIIFSTVFVSLGALTFLTY